MKPETQTVSLLWTSAAASSAETNLFLRYAMPTLPLLYKPDPDQSRGAVARSARVTGRRRMRACPCIACSGAAAGDTVHARLTVCRGRKHHPLSIKAALGYSLPQARKAPA